MEDQKQLEASGEAEGRLSRQKSLADSSDAYTWDIVLVFKVGDEKKTVNVIDFKDAPPRQVPEPEHFANQAAIIVEDMKEAGLKVLLYKSIQKDEVYCLVGASEERIKVEAARTRYDLLMNPDVALEKCVEKGMKLAKLTVESEKPDASETIKETFAKSKWNDLFAPYVAEDAKESKTLYTLYPAANERKSIFRSVDRLRLTAAIIKNDKELGGAAVNISACLKSGTHPMCAYFCLDNEAQKKDLQDDWFQWQAVWNQPLDKIRNYYGESVSLYFAFIQYYSQWLILPSIVGFGAFIYQLDDGIDTPYNPIYAVVVAGWASLFLEAWKRRNATLNAHWGMSSFLEKEQARPGFQGEYQPSPIHGGQEEIFSLREKIKRALLGQTVIWTLIGVVLAAVASIFLLRPLVVKAQPSIGPILVGLINSVQIQILNTVYGKVSLFLNEYENHRTESEFENALIAKSFLFKFVNSYNSLFYLCFIKKYDVGCGVDDDPKKDCLGEVRFQLATIFITNLVVNNAIELGTPFIEGYLKNQKESQGVTEEQKALLTEPEKQYEKSSYESTFSDFDELAIQFGYAALFVVAFPITPLLALINNFFEIRLDASKLILATRRPEPKGACNIGTWFAIFNIIGFIAVMTNCGIIIFVSSKTIGKVTSLPGVQFVIFLILEHLLFLAKFAIDYFVPDAPGEISEHLERQKYIVDILINGLKDPHGDLAEAEARSKNEGNTAEVRAARVKTHYDFATIADTFTDTAHLDVYGPAAANPPATPTNGASNFSSSANLNTSEPSDKPASAV